MTKNISSSQPSRCLHTPKEARELLRGKFSWLYQHIRSCSGHIRYLDREAKLAKSLKELMRSH